ncbi:phage portal protein [Lentilactobacillus sp. SPB1-3]|uniref:Phage portal protein n=1 Tax=Lentilactobacillus terminaliae TaxID=3003483 RepID=A0ACD5DCM2_9LACO|nr:phage portal protein [Lentilactobacillus sp. SPB1-3]MCZ0978080.1 phage portal protein [Lentilactobacillus sp. SPB1-3]
MTQLGTISQFLKDRDGPSRFISGVTSMTNSDSRWLSEHVYLDDNDIPRCAPDFNIENNLDEISVMLSSYDTMLRNQYHRKMRYYKGDHETIRDRIQYTAIDPEKNRIVVNVARNLVNTFSGFFIGIPPKITYAPNSDKKINQTRVDLVNEIISRSLSDSDSDDVFYELAKKADIYGRSYLVAYIANDDDKTLKFTHKAPENAFIVYSNNEESRPMFGFTFDSVDNRQFGMLHTPNNIYKFNSDDLESSGGFEASLKWKNNIFRNVVGMEFITELPENDERLGMFDDLVSLIDAQDKVLSEKIDDNDNFSNAILLTKGVAEFTAEQKQEIKHWRVMQVNNTDPNVDPEVDYLDKPNADGLQENSMKHLSDKIYDGSQVVNLADPSISSAASGFALTQRMQPMEMVAATKAEKMRKTIKRLLNIILRYNGFVNDDVADILRDIKVEFTPNVPHSEVDESTIVKNLNGIVSKRTLISYLSRVQNIDDELKAEEEEAEKRMTMFSEPDSEEGALNDDQDEPPKGGDA